MVQPHQSSQSLFDLDQRTNGIQRFPAQEDKSRSREMLQHHGHTGRMHGILDQPLGFALAVMQPGQSAEVKPLALESMACLRHTAPKVKQIVPGKAIPAMFVSMVSLASPNSSS